MIVPPHGQSPMTASQFQFGLHSRADCFEHVRKHVLQLGVAAPPLFFVPFMTSECGNQTKTLGNANVNVNASPLPRSVDANDNNNNNSANQHQRRALSAACNSLFQRTAPHTVGDDLRASRIELPPMAADVKPLNAAASNMLPSMNACDGGGGGSGSSAARPRSEQSSVADGGSAKQRNKITQKEHYETTFEPCQVCGDKASGRHYGVVSCEGCKGFFKRSIRRSMNYECRGTRSCMVNKAFRNRCQHCRLRKCLETGMKSEAVQHERKPLISTTQYTDMNKSQSSMSSAFSVSPSSTAFGSTDTINSVLQSSAEKALPTGIGNLTEKMQSQSTATPIESTSASLADLHQDECLASESDKQRDAARYDPDGDGDDACVQRASKRMRFCTEPAPCLSNSHIEPASSVSSENDKWPRPETTQSHCSSPTCTPAAVRSGRAASAPIHGVSTYESAPDSNATIDDQAAVRKLIKDIYACNLRWFESVPILPEREARRTFSSDESLFDSFLLTCFQLLDEFKLKQLCQKLFIAMRTIQTDSLAQNGDEQPNSAGLHEQLELAEFFQVVAYLASEFAQAHFEENEVTYLKLLAICNPGTNAMGVCDSVQGVARAGAQLTQFVQLFTHISTQFHLYLEQKRCQAKDSEAERLSTLQKLNATFKILLMLSRLPHKGHVQKLLVTLINSDKDESLVD